MLLRRKQKPNDDEQLGPHVGTWQATEREEVGRSNSGTARFAEFSRLSAKMVELSLQEAQRDLTLRGTVPDKLSAVSSPLLWPSTDVQRNRTATDRKRRETGNGGAEGDTLSSLLILVCPIFADVGQFVNFRIRALFLLIQLLKCETSQSTLQIGRAHV